MDKNKNIPFSHLWIHKHLMGGNIKTLLDVGCGNGEFMRDLAMGENWTIDGIDIYSEEIKKAKKMRVYRKLILGDVNKRLIEMVRIGNKYDVILCSQLIEHMQKQKGEQLISLMGKLAGRKVIVTTPNDFMKQPSEFNYSNPYQEHRSGWSVGELKKRGFVVYGMGLGSLWGDNGIARSRDIFLRNSARFISLLAAPIVFLLPQAAVGLIAVKKV